MEKGYRWKDIEERGYEITMKPADLPESIKEVTEEALGWLIGCEHEEKCNHNCTNAFKLILQELQFYKRMNIPLLHPCHNCRHHERLEQRNIFKLWHRKCQGAGASSENKIYRNNSSHFHGAAHCPNEFETTYSPEKSDIVYCEQCYNAEVV